MKKLALILIVVSGILGNVYSQFIITGTVTDDSTGDVIPGANIIEKGTTNGTITDINGNYSICVNDSVPILTFAYIGYINEEVPITNHSTINVKLTPDISKLEEVVVIGYGVQRRKEVTGAVSSVSAKKIKRTKVKNLNSSLQGQVAGVNSSIYGTRSNSEILIRGISTINQNYTPETNSESYAEINESGFKHVSSSPLSTFSIDVDNASYTNVRRYLNNGQKPPADAVRIEEMINYFSYDYEQPTGEHPLTIQSEVAACPWNEEHRIMHIGLQGLEVDEKELPPSNLVFLIDVSGSMGSANKLPLLKQSLKLLVNKLRDEDRVSMVVYAGAAGLVLPPTKGSDKDKILNALNNLSAGGSTAGGAGIKLAYATARKNLIKEGNNRVILATDGDFNVGLNSDKDMQKLIEEERESGIFLTCLGYGMGNYKDSKMETLADKGNGNYAYIDNIQEAQKVLVNEFGGTMFTIAKDVKLQVEFNPVVVQAYRLIGYENRELEAEDFQDDTKDAGELGSGHSVTAVYEIIPVGVKSEFVKSVSPLKYRSVTETTNSDLGDELATIKFRYKQPDGETSTELVKTVSNSQNTLEELSANASFASSVALFGMLLRNSEYVQNGNYETVLQLAKKGKAYDDEGYKAEFIRLVKTVQSNWPKMASR